MHARIIAVRINTAFICKSDRIRSGFRNGQSHKGSTFIVNQSLEKQRKIKLTFVGYEKTFDKVIKNYKK